MSLLKLFGAPPGGAPGVTDHAALDNLPYAVSGHTGFVPSQGEALIDILRLNQNVIRDSGGNNRIQLATSSPHVTLSGDIRAGDRVSIGCAPHQKTGLRLVQAPSDNSGGWGALAAMAGLDYGIPSNAIVGVGGKANISGGKTAITAVRGLDFLAAHTGSHTAAEVTGIAVQTMCTLSGSHATLVQGILVDRIGAVLAGANIATAIGINVRDLTQLAHNYTDVYGLKLADLSHGANRIIIEAGPSTPYLRLLGGSDPAAGQTHLFLKVGSTLKHVIEVGGFLKVA